MVSLDHTSIGTRRDLHSVTLHTHPPLNPRSSLSTIEMPTGKGKQRNDNSTNGSTLSPGGAPSVLNCNPRRRKMSIEDMLNPSDDDKRASVSPSLSSISESSTSAGSEENRTLRTSRTFKHSPRPSSSRSSRFSPYARSDSSRSTSPDDNVRVRPRSFRPAYEQDQSDFVWFHRVDLGWSWQDTEAAFHEQYPGERNKGGLQCKYYRVRDANGIPKCRAADKAADDSQKHGMWVKAGRRYPWMEPYAARLPGRQRFHDSQP